MSKVDAQMLADTHPLIPDYGQSEFAKLRRRHRKEKRFISYGVIAILVAVLFLFSLLYTVFSAGIPAFHTHEVKLSVQLDAEAIDPQALEKANYSKMVRDSLLEAFPEVTKRRDKKQLYGLVSNSAGIYVRDAVVADPTLVGQTLDLWVLAASDVDMVLKGKIVQQEGTKQRISDKQFGWIQALQDEGKIRSIWNATFWSAADSREPEQAGVMGAMIGSFYVLIVCIAVAFPVAVAAAVYLEEFAKKNRWTDLIELNINNLAAVPSIVYGLLALSVFLQLFGLPRSSPMVGGLALSLLVLPIIVITTRNALQSVPPSIRDAAIGLGASPVQVVFHHTLPAALPGIMTGTILAIARALGETAPLLMVGMVAFVADVPSAVTDPSTVLPVQIYIWADSPEVGFREKTSAAIMVLLGFLLIANMSAAWIRKKFEIRW